MGTDIILSKLDCDLNCFSDWGIACCAGAINYLESTPYFKQYKYVKKHTNTYTFFIQYNQYH